MTCPLCGAANSTAFFRSETRKPRRAYVHCATCDLVFVPPVHHLCAAKEKDRYDLHQNDGADAGYRRHLARIVNPLAAVLPSQAAGLDFGCGPGPVLQAMLGELGFTVRVYDPFYAPEMGWLEESYDFITATEVVEHLRAPGVELDRLWRMLRSGGILALMTQLWSPTRPFADWHYKNDPTHIAFFSNATMTHLADRWKAQLDTIDVDVFFFRKG